MTTPFPFVSGAVLTAAQMNDITNLPINDQTASYTLVVGDAGKRVVMDVATDNTVTVDDSVFTTGDTIFISTKDAATTVTAGAGVTIDSASGLVLVQHQSGQLVALSASSFLFVLSAGPAPAVPAAGLTFISAGTFTTASTASLPNSTFTSTFRNYKVIYNVTVATASVALTMRLRASGTDDSTSNYLQGSPGFDSGAVVRDVANSSATSLTIGTTFSGALTQVAIVLDVLNPQLSEKTFMAGNSSFILAVTGHVQGNSRNILFNATTAFDSMTLISSVASSITGVFRVYGYSDS